MNSPGIVISFNKAKGGYHCLCASCGKDYCPCCSNRCPRCGSIYVFVTLQELKADACMDLNLKEYFKEC